MRQGKAKKKFIINFMKKNKEKIIARNQSLFHKFKGLKWNNISENINQLKAQKLRTIIRGRLYYILKNNPKNSVILKDIGCSVSELKIYLEKQFTKGMNWDNWAFKGWHIDHDKPLSLFDLSNEEEFRKASHYTNLKPMWWRDNISKGKKYQQT